MMSDPTIRADAYQHPGEVDYPLLPLKNVVIFPRTSVSLVVGRLRSVKALEQALAGNARLLVLTQRDLTREEPRAEDLYQTGIIAEVVQHNRQPDGHYQVTIEGLRRVQAVHFTATEYLYSVTVREVAERGSQGSVTEALSRHVLDLFSDYLHLNQRIPADVLGVARGIHNPGHLADLIAAHVISQVDKRQQLLEIADSYERLEAVGVFLVSELEVLQIDERIRSKVRQQIDKNQREFYLREQLKAIHDELAGEGGNEIADLRQKVVTLGLPEEVAAKMLKELGRLERVTAASPEAAVIRNYVDWVLALPWQQQTTDKLNMAFAKQVLDEDHYWLDKVKERILEYLAVRQLVALGNHKGSAQILCFAGPPGVGKTSLGQSIARSLDRKFVRISLGGVRDEAEVRGHRRTYIGAMPGRIIQGIKTAATLNPVVLLDEIDKMSSDYKGDPTAAMLEVLDPAQNNTFVDHYLDIPFDLSQVLFICTANVLADIPRPLRDRMEIIELSGYSEEEKLQIARRYLMSRELDAHGLKAGYIEIPEKVYRAIIRHYTHEAGVRDLARKLAAICRKAARRMVEGRTTRVRITLTNLEEYLGLARYAEDKVMTQMNQIGVVSGLAYTEAGGAVLPVEVATMPGHGSLLITGRLGDVMQESARAALSYVRSRAAQLKIEPNFQEKLDLHIHFPEGAVPKDGPSAGIAIATALISALTRQPVRGDTGMTGEITLRGRVLPIGGLREKATAAHRAGIKRVIAPHQNERDLPEIPRIVRQELEFIWVESMDEVIAAAFQFPLELLSQGEGGSLPPILELPASESLIASPTNIDQTDVLEAQSN